MALANKVIYQNGAIREFEKPEVCEAIKVANANKWTVGLTPIEWDEREARLKKEYEKDTKAPGPGEEQPKEGNPALNESASQFNDALLDEQAKKIEEFTKKNVRLGEEIVRLNKAIYKKNLKIEELRKESSRHLRGKIKMFYENIDLEGKLKDKDAVLSDVAEELRLTKIREKNLAELGLKYVGENEELKKELADKVVDKIDAQALKSAESALAWKEKVLAYKGMALAYYKKKIAEKDEDIRALKLQISTLEKSGNGIDWKRNADVIQLYVNRASRERLWNPINQDICNEKELSFIINHGGKRVKYALRFDGTDIVYECSDPDKKPRIPTPEEPKHDNSFKDFTSKTIDNFNRRAAELGCVGSMDGNGIIEQMVGVDIAEEGGDQSATIVQCGNGITISKEEAEIIERCAKNGTELHYSEKDGFTYTNVFGKEIPIRCLRGMFHVFTDEEIENMKSKLWQE